MKAIASRKEEMSKTAIAPIKSREEKPNHRRWIAAVNYAWMNQINW
ncbi:MAG: hypothetical protein V7K26_30790 [Nostoc sp.]